jgi:sec-independent protein translocase protein TatC
MATYTRDYPETKEQLEEGSMSFLDHLDELRTRLIRSAMFVMVAFVVCWIFSDKIYNFLQVPVRKAMLEARRTAEQELSTVLPKTLADFEGRDCLFPLPADRKLGSALIQPGTTVRVRVQRAEDGSLQLATLDPVILNSNTVLDAGSIIPPELYRPANVVMGPEGQLVVGTVQGAFNLYIKVAFYAAIFFAVPFLLIQAWGFVAPGLYPHEKKYASPIIIMASAFFLLGCAFAYYVAFPRAANFLLGVAAGGNLRPLVTADEYFDLIILIMLGLGVVFEIPTITFFTSRLGLVSPGMLLRVWRYAIVVIFIVAAVLSPTTDIPNLLVFAAPMIMLYFGSVGIAWVFHRKRRTEREYQAMERKEGR